MPSDTVRRYQHLGPSCCAHCATRCGGVSDVATTRLVRRAPFEGELCVVVARGWSPQRVSAGTATHATVPTHAAHAAQHSGLWPYRQAAARERNGKALAAERRRTMSAANWGVVCKRLALGTAHVVRRVADASLNHCFGRHSRVSTRAYPGRAA